MGAKADAVQVKLREARIEIDRMKVAHYHECETLVVKLNRLEKENEALREMVQTVTLGGKGAVL